MYEVLTTLLTKALSKIFDTSVDIASKDVSWKRSISAKFINFFSTFLELENISKELYYEVKEISEGSSPLVKVVLRNKFDKFFQTYQRFLHELREIQSMLLIYDNELLIKIEGLRVGKSQIVLMIDLLLQARPLAIKENERATTLITYPTKSPSHDLVSKRKFPDLNREGLEQEANQLRRSITKNLQFVTVDLSIPKESKIAIENAYINIQQIEKLRADLADFIKQSFPLEDVSEVVGS